ncbi:MAG: hypothetical protein QM647_11915 [Asticcacaulis sp.]|uniref:hypothetical protein n=1 Tax=Asticcacaulis sp. TaxID=1872648 RepID=UPI0039E64DB3
MRLLSLLLVSTTWLGLALSACSTLPIGPDLAKAPTPFGDAPLIRLITNDPETPPIEIRHTDTGDSAILPVSPMSKDKPFNATITYYGFTANTDDHQDYWLAGANIFQTADRSAYAVIRYPHGAEFQSGSHTNGEMLIVTCAMRGVYPPLTRPQKEDTPNDATASISSDHQDESGLNITPLASDDKACDFNSQDELYAFLLQLVRAAADEAASNKKKSENDRSSDYEWQTIRIVIP